MNCNECSKGCSVIKEESTDYYICATDGYNKLNVHNWLSDIPSSPHKDEVVEIRFKNTRKGYYINTNSLSLKKGDVVAVEASPGHDIGVVSLTGELVNKQMRKINYHPPHGEFRKIYRKAKPVDIEKWELAQSLENDTMIRSRQIVNNLSLDMKIGDVEYQGDKTKAIFYYIADERVDFRELIKVLADEFKIRIEMRQIGTRQEAGRIGGIGACGRELCCSTWITNFVSVTTNAARYQEISLNPQKLAGQCSKLKCCLNYELDAYLDARKDFPDTRTILETADGNAYHIKTDIFKKIMWYSFDPNTAVNITAVPVKRVNQIIRMNRSGKKPLTLVDAKDIKLEAKNLDFKNVVGQDSLTRFEDKKPKKRSNNKRNKNKRRRPNNEKKNNNNQKKK
jgi:cell fate regulator YaaT (PSP1 superfamily)